jgi:hypothetical protein
MVPRRTMCYCLHLLSRMLVACLSVWLSSGGWLIVHAGDGGLTGTKLAHHGIVFPAVAGPGHIPAQQADRLVGGGGSALLSIARLRGGGVVTHVTLFSAHPPCGFCVRPVAMHGAQLPWVLMLSVCLQL